MSILKRLENHNEQPAKVIGKQSCYNILVKVFNSVINPTEIELQRNLVRDSDESSDDDNKEKLQR